MTGCISGTKSGRHIPEDLSEFTETELKEIIGDADLLDWRGQKLRLRVRNEIKRRAVARALQTINMEQLTNYYVSIWIKDYDEHDFNQAVSRFNKER